MSILYHRLRLYNAMKVYTNINYIVYINIQYIFYGRKTFYHMNTECNTTIYDLLVEV